MLSYPLWGKAGKDRPPEQHSALIAHLLSVAACFYVLIETSLVRQRLKALWGRQLTDADTTLLVWLTALHDIGKCDHRFQRKRADVRKLLIGGDPKTCTEAYFHGDAGWLDYEYCFLKALGHSDGLKRRRRKDPPLPEVDFLRGLINASCAHHGTLVTKGGGGLATDEDLACAKRLAVDLRALFEQVIAPLPLAGDRVALPTAPVQGMSALYFYAGLVTVADWLGSDEQTFPFIDCITLERTYPGVEGWKRLFAEYLETARQRVAKLTLFKPLQVDSALAAARHQLIERHGYCLRPIQAEIVKQLQPSSDPHLLLIEAPMGAGKTEAALLAAAKFIDAGLAHGVAFALPTQAAANQNHTRLMEIAECWFNYRAARVHGKADLADFVEAQGQSNRAVDRDHESALTFCDWIGDSRKRAFLHPVCACTIDQMELAVLHARHGFVRAMALARHVVVIDEIHAYDAYMSAILDQLLHFLGAAAVPTVLLSATLPTRTRQRLINAYRRGAGRIDSENKEANRTDYPLSLHFNGTQLRPLVSEAATPTRPPLAMYPCTEQAGEDQVLDCAATGGCAALICNTVGSALERFRRLKHRAQERYPDVVVELFHARFRFADRSAIEAAVIHRFGKLSDTSDEEKRARRRHRILVATQVVEQSLDLDFDTMVSELAPIDLLLQRAGRMHRHAEHDTVRPENYRLARLGVILPPDLNDGETPKWWRDTQKVYEESGPVLTGSGNWLRNGRDVALPGGIAEAVRAVYDPLDEVTPKSRQGTDKASRRVIQLDSGKVSDPAAGRDPSYETRDGNGSLDVLLVVTDANDDTEMVPVWNSAARCWERHPLPCPHIPGQQRNPAYINEIRWWSLAIRQDSEAGRWVVQASRDGDGQQANEVYLMECHLQGERLIVGRFAYSLELGLHHAGE